jgi:hypothetical protein
VETSELVFARRKLKQNKGGEIRQAKLDKNINWKNHIQKILPKLGSAC